MKKAFTLRRGEAKRKRGFSLIELLVVVVIFMMIFLMTMAFVRLASGSVISARQKLLTNDIRNVTETISQKMNNANASMQIDIGNPPKVQSDGFTVFDLGGTKVLSVVSQDQNGKTECIPILLKDHTIWTRSKTPGIGCFGVVNLSEFTMRLTPEEIAVTRFDLNGFIPGTPTNPPYLKMIIEAEDADPQYSADNKIKFQTSYTIDYLTWKNMQ